MNDVFIGKIVNTHGIKGELRILSDFEYKEKAFLKGMKIYIGNKKEEEEIATYRHHKVFEMITLKGYQNINEVLKYKGLPVYVKRADLQLSSQEYLDADLIGFQVIADGKNHGIIKQIQKLAKGNKLLQILDQEKTVLVPFRKEFIEKVDLQERKIVIKTIPGLFV